MSDRTPNPDAVYFIDDVCEFLKVNRRTVERLRRHGAFPVPELSSLDKRPRWSGADILAYIHRDAAHRGRSLRAVAR